MDLLYILCTGQIIKSQQYRGREASRSFSFLWGGKEGGTHLPSFTPVEIAGACLTWRRKADSYGKVARLLQQCIVSRFSARYPGHMDEATKEAKKK